MEAAEKIDKIRSLLLRKIGIPTLGFVLFTSILSFWEGNFLGGASCFLIFVGGLFNLSVFFANQKRMPARNGIERDVLHCNLGEKTRLAFLGDTISVGRHNASPGDIIVVTGLLLLCLTFLPRLK